MRTGVLAFVLAAFAYSVACAHTNVAPAQVKAMLDAGAHLTVVDVREAAEFCDSTFQPPGHIVGAVNMPWNSGYLQAHYGELAPDETTIVVCRSGGRSHAAATFLDGVGFTQVFDMVGGMLAWQWETETCHAASILGPGSADLAALLLGPATPNPCRDQTEILYAIPASESLTRAAMTVHDSRGRLVSTLVDNKRSAGTHCVVWNGRDARGRPAASGVYFYRLTWNGQSETRRMVLLR